MNAAESFCRLENVKSCPACGSPERRELFTAVDWLHGLPGVFPEVRCQACGLIYLAERPIPEDLHLYYPDDAYYAYKTPASYDLFWRKDRMATAWYYVKRSVLSHEYGYRHLGGSPLLSILLGLPLFGTLHGKATFNLKGLLHPWIVEGTLLEVGCGAGMYLGLMRALGWTRVVGVDFSAKAVQQARDVLGIEAYCGDLRALGLSAETFDAVSLSHTLEHIPDTPSFLSEVCRLLKRGGRLAIVVPNADGLCARRFQQHWYGLDPPRHVVNFTAGSLVTALKRAGLRTESLTTTWASVYYVALFSRGRQVGDHRSVYTDPNHRFALSRRLGAARMVLRSYVARALGRSAGEELIVVARRPE